MGQMKTAKPPESDTALSVCASVGRAMRSEPKFLNHFGEGYLRLVEHIINIAIKERPFRFTKFNDYVIKLIFNLPDRFQSMFCNLAINPGYDTLIPARKVMLDNLIEKAIKEEAFEQVVILGAGYDPKAIIGALKHPNVKMYEVDMDGPTRDQKLNGIRTYKGKSDSPVFKLETRDNGTPCLNNNLFFVSCNLGQGNLKNQLEDNEFDPRRKTLVIAEGLTMYLTEGTVDALLDQLNDLLSEDSSVVMSIMPPRKIGFPLNLFLRSSNEVVKFFKPLDEVPDYVREHGFEVQEKFTVESSMRLSTDPALKRRYDKPEKTVEPYYFLVKCTKAKESYSSFRDIPEVSEVYSTLNQRKLRSSPAFVAADETVETPVRTITTNYERKNKHSKQPSVILVKPTQTPKKRCCALQ